MNFLDFTNLFSATADPLSLIEGRRAITESGALDAQRLDSMLAECFPNLRFRSGILKPAAPDIRSASLETLEYRLCFKTNGRLG